MTCGAHTGAEVFLDLWKLFAKQISLLGAYLGTMSELREVLRLLSLRHLYPIIHRIFPLAQAAEAQRLLESRQVFGKVLIEVP